MTNTVKTVKTVIDRQVETTVNMLKQAMIDEAHGELVNVFSFHNGGTKFKVIMSMGNYSVVYDCKNDRLIIAWGIYPLNDGTASWGQGYYYDSDDNYGLNDPYNRYHLERVAKMFLFKVGLLSEDVTA